VRVFDRRPRVEYDPDGPRREVWQSFTLAAG
jgi:para-nitrobenzyl esterase